MEDTEKLNNLIYDRLMNMTIWEGSDWLASMEKRAEELFPANPDDEDAYFYRARDRWMLKELTKEETKMKSWNGLNILEYIDWLMEQGISEENANEIADNEFGN